MNILKANGKMVKFVFVWDPSEADYERDFNVNNLEVKEILEGFRGSDRGKRSW